MRENLAVPRARESLTQRESFIDLTIAAHLSLLPFRLVLKHSRSLTQVALARLALRNCDLRIYKILNSSSVCICLYSLLFEDNFRTLCEHFA